MILGYLLAVQSVRKEELNVTKILRRELLDLKDAGMQVV